MPIKVVQGLPAAQKLLDEGVHVIFEERALKQNIRPLRIAILNLMPTKETTELQLLRLLGGTPLQIEVDFLHTESYQSKNISTHYLETYYKTFEEIKDEYYDGLILTGAPVEHIPFEQVAYYEELTKIIKWSEEHVYSRFFICWSAQFALNHYYGIEKINLEEKLFGIYSYKVIEPESPFVRGFDDFYSIPESRHTTMDAKQINSIDDLIVLSQREDLGPDLLSSIDQRDLFIFGHLEYDRYTLEHEYKRDINEGLEINVPENYYPNNDASEKPRVSWRSNAYNLFSNWVNETYQKTPFDITAVNEVERNIQK